MKDHMGRINQKAASFLSSTRILLFISLVLILGSIYPGYASAQRKYSVMSTSEAEQHIKRIIEDRKVPPPFVHPFKEYRWKPPEVGLYARGVKLDDTDYIVFAAAKPSVSMIVYYGSGLEEFVPEVVRAGGGIEFKDNGILFSTIDIEVVNLPVLIEKGTRWGRGNRVIGKGGYVWYIGPVGIFLKGDTSNLLIQFKEPIKDFPFSSIPTETIPIYMVEFSILQGADARILVKVEGKDIQLK